MTAVVGSLGERDTIARLRRDQTFFWIDVRLGDTSPGELTEVLDIPERVLRRLLHFQRSGASARTFYADGQHVAFALTCYLESPVEVHVLITGDYLLTLHEAPDSLPERLSPEAPDGGSERYAVYAVLDEMVATAFDALSREELKLHELLSASADLRGGRGRMEMLGGIGARLSAMRGQIAPQRGIFERIIVEIGRLKGLEPDDQRYFERLGAQLNRLIDGIDAAANAMTTLISLRLNETNYWLTVVATVFLPLTFITGFFGMNFGWMVDQVDTAVAFWLLGVGSLVVGVILIWRLIVRDRPS